MPTDKAIKYFKSLSSKEKIKLAEEAGISLGTLRNIFYSKHSASVKTICAIEKASKRKMSRYEIAPEVDWTVFLG